MSDSTTLLPAIISGASALFGGAIGTLLVERYKMRNQRHKERSDRIEQATSLFVVGLARLQDHILHKRFEEARSQLGVTKYEFSANLPCLPTVLTSLANEAIPLFSSLLFLIASTEVADPQDDDDGESGGVWEYTLKLAMLANWALDSWRLTGDEAVLQEVVSQLAKALKSVAQIAEDPS